MSAAWLHDVLDHKLISDPAQYERKEKIMREFLAARFTAEQVTLIFDIISNVSFSKEVTVSRQSLYDS
jgi:HD superfamily phosphodiesterase